MSISMRCKYFSDYQLRPLVEGTVVPSSNWYVNCTPGGMFPDVVFKTQDAAVSKSTPPKYFVFLVGTNNICGRCRMERATKQFKNLLHSAPYKFPTSKLCLLMWNMQAPIRSHIRRGVDLYLVCKYAYKI